MPKAGDDAHLRNRLRGLAAKHVSYGYLFLHRLLRQEGLVANKKRTYRIYTEEGLQARTKKRKGLIRYRTDDCSHCPKRPLVNGFCE